MWMIPTNIVVFRKVIFRKAVREMYIYIEKYYSVMEIILLHNRATNEESNCCEIIAMTCFLMEFRLTLRLIIIFKHLYTITRSKIYFLFDHITKFSTSFNNVT